MKLLFLVFLFAIAACSAPMQPAAAEAEAESHELLEAPSIRPPETEAGSVGTSGGVTSEFYLRSCVATMAQQLLAKIDLSENTHVEQVAKLRWLANESSNYEVEESLGALSARQQFRLQTRGTILYIQVPPTLSCDMDLESDLSFLVIRMVHSPELPLPY